MSKTHISLNVANLDRSVQFYEGFLGSPFHKRRPGYANFDLQDPPLKLALQEEAPDRGGGSLNHLGIMLETPEAVQSVRERLIRSGLATFDEGDTTCCYARQNKVWVTDPDGNRWEVYVLLDDMMEDDPHNAPDGDRSCCMDGEPASCCEADQPTKCCS